MTESVADGSCVDQVCLPRGCGDFIVNGSEQCDGTRFLAGADDCSDVGFYGSGPIACNSDCTIDDGACAGLGFCGDGETQSMREACDFMDSASVSSTCASLGFHEGDSVMCTPFCTYATAGVCDERCGDGIINGPELCEPGQAVPRHLSCLDYGFDSGDLACGDTCSVDVMVCRRHGLSPVSSSTNTMHGLWQAAAADAFLVGENGVGNGVMLRWDGAEIRSVVDGVVPPPPAFPPLHAVGGTSPTNVIAVGGSGPGTGTIVRFDGTTLTPVLSNAAQRLADVHMRTPTDGYAVGDEGLILHFDGTGWTPMTSTVTADLYAVFATSATDVWAVGQGSTVLRGNGVTWTLVTPDISAEELADVWGTSPTNVYVVGDNGGVYHFNGTWTQLEVPTGAHLDAIWGSAADDIHIVGNSGTHLRWDGAVWLAFDRETLARLTSVSGFDPTHALVIDEDKRLLQWQGAGWSRNATMSTTSLVTDLWGTSSTNVYAVSDTNIFRFDGEDWGAFSGAGNLHLLWGASADEVFAVGDRKITHALPGSSTNMTLPTEIANDTAALFQDVWGASNTNVYAITQTRVARFDGTNWSVVAAETPATADFKAIWGSSATEIWIVGTNRIHHFDGTTLTTRHTETGMDLLAVWGSDASHVWAVGADGRVMFYDGTTWKRLTDVLTTRQLTNVHGTAANDVFVSGIGTLLHFDGSAWSPIDPEAEEITALWVLPREIAVSPNTQAVRRLVRACATCL